MLRDERHVPMDFHTVVAIALLLLGIIGWGGYMLILFVGEVPELF